MFCFRIRDKDVDVVKLYNEQRGSGKDLLNLVVVGHVDAGKSTLMGHLLYLQVRRSTYRGLQGRMTQLDFISKNSYVIQSSRPPYSLDYVLIH